MIWKIKFIQKANKTAMPKIAFPQPSEGPELLRLGSTQKRHMLPKNSLANEQVLNKNSHVNTDLKERVKGI